MQLHRQYSGCAIQYSYSQFPWKAAKPLPVREAAVHFVLIQTLLLLKCKSGHYHVIKIVLGLYQREVNCSLTAEQLAWLLSMEL